VLAVAVLVVAVVVVVWLGPGPAQGDFGLNDTGDYGAKALRLTFEDFDRQLVEISPQGVAGFDSVIVPNPNRASDVEIEAWRSYVSDGGTLILVDPWSIDFGAGRGLGAGPVVGDDDKGICDIPVLDSMPALELNPRYGSELIVRSGDRSCFGDGDNAQVVATEMGEGWLVTLGSAAWITNEGLRGINTGFGPPIPSHFDDTATVMLALAQLHGSPQPEGFDPTSDVGYVRPDFTPAGDPVGSLTFWSFVRPSVKAGLVQLLVATLFLAWFSARRLGRVVPEPQPVNIAGSDLVEAVGELMRRRKNPASALTVLRTRAISELGVVLHLGPYPDRATLVPAVAKATGEPEAHVVDILYTATASDNASLVYIVDQLDRIRMEILHGSQRV
jgi:hypothetical protein